MNALLLCDQFALLLDWFLLFFPVNVSSFQKTERNLVALGSNVLLSCRFSSYNPVVRWLHIDSDNTALQYVISNGVHVEPEYEGKASVHVYQTTGEYNLSLFNVQWNESGWYVCIDDGSNSLHVKHPYWLNVRGQYLELCYINVLLNS